LYREIIFETLMPDDFIVLGEDINFILIMIHLGLHTQRFEKPNSSKELSQFQECWAVRNSSLFPTWAKYFFFSVAATQNFGPPEMKWQEPEAVHSPPSGAEFKNAWSFISIPPYVFMVSCFIN
jgi:hypothetical protein